MNGATSRDPDAGDFLSSYRWTLVERPPGSAVVLDAESLEPTVAFTPDKVGRYRVQLVVKDSFGWESEPDTVTVEVLPAYAAPNPASTWITFYHDGNLAAGTLRIYNVAGRLVHTLTLRSSGSTGWDLTDSTGRPLASGLYLWLLFDREGRQVLGKPERLVIQR